MLEAAATRRSGRSTTRSPTARPSASPCIGQDFKTPVVGDHRQRAVATAPGCTAADQRSAYEHHHRCLQVLQRGGVRGRWTLKTPAPRHGAGRPDGRPPRRPPGATSTATRWSWRPRRAASSARCRARSATPTTATTSPSAGPRCCDESVNRIDAFRAAHPEHPIARRPLPELVADPLGDGAAAVRRVHRTGVGGADGDGDGRAPRRPPEGPARRPPVRPRRLRPRRSRLAVELRGYVERYEVVPEG